MRAVYPGGSVRVKHCRIGIGGKQRTGEQNHQHTTYQTAKRGLTHSHTPFFTVSVSCSESYPPLSLSVNAFSVRGTAFRWKTHDRYPWLSALDRRFCSMPAFDK